MSKVLKEMEGLKADRRPSVKDFVALLQDNLNKALTHLLRGEEVEAKQILNGILEKGEFLKKGLGTGASSEEYVKSWLQTLLSTSGIIATLCLLVLGFISREFLWQVGFAIGLLVFLATAMFLVTAFFSLKAHGKLTYAVRAGLDGYEASRSAASLARGFFIAAIILLGVAVLTYAITFLPQLN